jgi:hypothetical protein
MSFWKKNFGSLKIIFYLEVVSLLIVNTVILFFMLGSRETILDSSDFPQYLSAASMIKEGQGNFIYDVQKQSSEIAKIVYPSTKAKPPFRNPPFVTLFYYPFSAFSLSKAYGKFSILNFSIVMLIIYLSISYFKNLSKFAFTLILPFAYYPIVLNIIRGQVSLYLDLAVLLTYFWLDANPLFSGMAYSFLSIKPQFFVVGLPFIMILSKDRKRFLAGVILASAALAAISVYMSGFIALVDYPSFVLSTEKIASGSPTNVMFSLYNFLSFILGELSVRNSIFILIVHLLLYIATLYLFVRTYKYQRELAFAAALIFIVLYAIHVLPYDLAIITTSIFILVDQVFSDINYWLKSVLLLIVMMILAMWFINLRIFQLYHLWLFVLGLVILVTGGKNIYAEK